jgi:hypothetical protein
MSAPGPQASLAAFARLADPNHSILIRALLDRESLTEAMPAAPFEGLSAAPSAYAMIAERSARIREESTFKFLEFRERWRKRLAWIQLGPFLQRNQWYQPLIGGFAAAGKGTRKDGKDCFDPDGDEPEQCWTTTPPGADGTYVDTDKDGKEVRGTFAVKDGKDCFDPEGADPEMCWSVTPPGADGSFTATTADGKTTVTVTPATTTTTTTATTPAPAAT